MWMNNLYIILDAVSLNIQMLICTNQDANVYRRILAHTQDTRQGAMKDSAAWNHPAKGKCTGHPLKLLVKTIETMYHVYMYIV